MNNKRLPIASIFLEAISLPQKYYQDLLKVGWPLIVLCVLVAAHTDFFPQDNERAKSSIMTISIAIVFYAALIVAIIGCHRIFLLDSNAFENKNIFYWTGNEIKYAGWSLLIIFGAILISLPLMLLITIEDSTIRGTLWDFLKIPIAYVTARWSLVLPSCAIDKHGHSLRWSWAVSTGNGWRLTILIIGLPFVLDVMLGLLPGNESLVSSIILSVFWLIVGVIQVGLLSLSYAYLVSDEELIL